MLAWYLSYCLSEFVLNCKKDNNVLFCFRYGPISLLSCLALVDGGCRLMCDSRAGH